MDEPLCADRGAGPVGRRAALGRADLLRVFATEGAEALQALALALGYSQRPSQPETTEPKTEKGAVAAKAQPPTRIERPPQLPSARFFYLRRREGDPAKPPHHETEPEWFQRATVLAQDRWDGPSQTARPRRQALAPWPRVWPFLRQVLGLRLPSREPDLPRLVGRISRGEALKRVPLRQRHTWSPRITLLIDYAAHARPFWDDYNALRRALERLHGSLGLDVRILQGDAGVAPAFRRPGEHVPHPWTMPAETVPLLILSDLGMLSGAPSSLRGWQRFGTRLRSLGVAATVLAPVPAPAFIPGLQREFALVEWDRNSTFRPSTTRAEGAPLAGVDAVEALLTLLAPAVFVELDLLRAMRFLLPAARGHVGLETAAWHHGEIATDELTLRFASLDAAETYQKRFRNLDPARQKAALALIFAFHAGLPESIRERERALAQRLVLDSTDPARVNTATAWEENMAKTCQVRAGSPQLAQWLARFDPRQSAAARRGNPALSALWVLARRDQLLRGEPLDLPPEIRREDVEFLLRMTTEATNLPCALRQSGQDLQLAMASAGRTPADAGSLCGELHLTERGVWVEEVLENEAATSRERFVPVLALPQPLLRLTRATRQVRLRSGAQTLEIDAIARPAWARTMGRDGSGLFAEVLWLGIPRRLIWQPPEGPGEGRWVADGPLGVDGFGLYADLEVEAVRQRFRWIAPGSFWMSSPESEKERGSDEVRHRVTLSRGYWLAETACTQALWQAVMGGNPSYFTDDPRNPVEQVSWEDAQGFIAKLKSRVAGLDARLPTEAEWEYACRAGTESRFSFGDEITPEQVNFGGHNRRTVPVGTLPANAWGLYEMHGNVYEWCADWYGEYGQGDQVDPQGPSQGDGRVMRGGSWADDGRRCRSAYRSWIGPGIRNFYLGFRLALGQQVSPGGQPAGEERPAGQPRRRRGGQDGRGAGQEKGAKRR